MFQGGGTNIFLRLGLFNSTIGIRISLSPLFHSSSEMYVIIEMYENKTIFSTK